MDNDKVSFSELSILLIELIVIWKASLPLINKLDIKLYDVTLREGVTL